MKTIDIVRFAVTGLWRRKARTFLTVLGVIIGTACIVMMLSVGITNYRQFEQDMVGSRSLTEIYVYQGENGPATGGTQSNRLTQTQIANLAAIEHIKAASPAINLNMTLKIGKYRADMYEVVALDPSVLDLEFIDGGLFAADSNMPQIILGGFARSQFQDPTVRQDYYSNYEEYDWEREMSTFPDIDWLNEDFQLTLGYDYGDEGGMVDENGNAMPTARRYNARICGITDVTLYSENSTRCYMHIDMAKQLIAENRALAQQNGWSDTSFDRAILIVEDMKYVEDVVSQIRNMGLRADSNEWVQETLDQQARQQGQLLAIGCISLFVSAIGIANTMYASILERRRDIGVMKVVGMRIRKIRLLYLTESALIGMLGGLIGIAISYILMLAINTSTGTTSFLGMYFQEGMQLSIPLWLSAGALGIAVGVGVCSGVYPAYKATRLSPLEAMRS